MCVRSGPQASGSRTLNEAPPPGRSSTHARPPWSSAKRATSESPTPDARRVRPRPGACRNGSKIASLRSSGTPAPSSSTTSRMPSSCVVRAAQIRAVRRCVARRVREQVLDDALDLRRGRRRPAAARRRTAPRGRRAARTRGRASRTSAPTSVGLRCGVMMPRCSRSRSSRSESSRSSLRAFEAMRWSRSTASSRGEVHPGLLERDRRPEDRGERRPQVVRDGLEERVLHLVERPQALRRPRARDGRPREYFCSLRRSACSARLRSVTSTISPRTHLTAPRASRGDVHDVAEPQGPRPRARASGTRGRGRRPASRRPARSAARHAPAILLDDVVAPASGSASSASARLPRTSAARRDRNVKASVCGSASQKIASRRLGELVEPLELAHPPRAPERERRDLRDAPRQVAVAIGERRVGTGGHAHDRAELVRLPPHRARPGPRSGRRRAGTRRDIPASTPSRRRRAPRTTR